MSRRYSSCAPHGCPYNGPTTPEYVYIFTYITACLLAGITVYVIGLVTACLLAGITVYVIGLALRPTRFKGAETVLALPLLAAMIYPSWLIVKLYIH
jgi:hypothetical protein